MLKRLISSNQLYQPYLFLFGLALILRLIVALWVRQPGFVDAYYYFQVAENWFKGQGLTESIVWNYQAGDFPASNPANLLEHPAFGYWMPLASFVTIFGFSVTGNASFWAGIWPFMLLAATLPPLAWWLGQMAFGNTQRRYSWLMALVTLFPGRYFLFWNTPDNFSLFALLSFLFFMSSWAGLYRSERWLLVAGGLGGLAYLSRSDGILLLTALIISFLIRQRQKIGEGEIRPRWQWLAVGLLTAGLVVTPWLIRNWLTFGMPVSSGSSKALYLRSYTDLFSYSLKLDANYYFSWGWNNILSSKLNAANLNLLILTVQGLFLAAPFFVLGLFFVRKNPVFLPFLVYLVVLYLAMTLVYSEISAHGTLFHSAGGLLPYQVGAALAGIEGLAAYLWRKKAGVAARVRRVGIGLAVLLAGLAMALTIVYGAGNGPDWDSDLNYSQKVGEWFKRNHLSDNVIIVGEPLSYYYATRQLAIGQASDGVKANLRAANRYGAKYLVLGEQHYDALDSLYQTKQIAGLKLIAEFDGNQIYQVLAGEGL